MIFKPNNNKCPLPNLAAEINLHNAGHPSTYANHANITESILNDFLNGRGEISDFELFGMTRLSRSATNTTCSTNYLLCDKLSEYDLSKRKHYQKIYVIYDDFKTALSVCPDNVYRDLANDIPSSKELLKQRRVSRALINKILRLTESMLSYTQEDKRTARGTTLLEELRQKQARTEALRRCLAIIENASPNELNKIISLLERELRKDKEIIHNAGNYI